MFRVERMRCSFSFGTWLFFIRVALNWRQWTLPVQQLNMAALLRGLRAGRALRRLGTGSGKTDPPCCCRRCCCCYCRIVPQWHSMRHFCVMTFCFCLSPPKSLVLKGDRGGVKESSNNVPLRRLLVYLMPCSVCVSSHTHFCSCAAFSARSCKLSN